MMLVAFLLAALAVPDVKVIIDLPYRAAPAPERCTLDVYAPDGARDLPCILWLHGGGLTAGHKGEKPTVAVARALAEDGHLVAVANYRLSPADRYPAYLEDAAAALAWLVKNAAAHGGNDRKVFVAGHSAGGYLSAMVGLDPRWLKPHGLSPDSLAGLVPVAGQMVTHTTVRRERGLPKTALIVDEAAPLHHVRKDAPPILFIHAERDMPLRAEENVLCLAALRAAGHSGATLLEVPGSDHGSVGHDIARPGNAAREAIRDFIRRTPAR